MPPTRLVVIGAGMAGIKLAHTCLLQDPSLQVTVLEANDYIGGRICSQKFEGHTVERGANWISGLTKETYDNPVWKLAQNVKLQGHVTNRDEEESVLALNGMTGADVTEEYMSTLQRFDTIYERAVEKCAERGIRPQSDVDVSSLLLECGWKKESELSYIEKTVQNNVLEVWVADSLQNLSAAHDMRPGMNDVDLGKEEVFVEDPRGFNTILDGIVHDIEERGGIIRLSTEVERVEYAPGKVQVTAKDLTTGEVTTYAANVVVCTVSLGVLQNNKIEFIPPLPDWKVKAIHEIDMFCFAKVYARFDKRFHPEKHQFAICTNKTCYYPFWMKYKNAEENLYMCYVGGKEAERVESLTEEEIKNEIEEHFRISFSGKFGELDSAIFRPTALAVTNWSKNPRFCGSYSSFPVHAFATVPESDLTSGLTGTNDRNGPKTLYFAGEGFDDNFNGWVQGAYRSGERVATSILGAEPEHQS